MAEGALIPGMQDQPERRYLNSGHVAHLLAYGVDRWSDAYCGQEAAWPWGWLGSGSQQEADEAVRLPLCKRCAEVAEETAEFIAGLASDLGLPPPGADEREGTA